MGGSCRRGSWSPAPQHCPLGGWQTVLGRGDSKHQDPVFTPACSQGCPCALSQQARASKEGFR